MKTSCLAHLHFWTPSIHPLTLGAPDPQVGLTTDITPLPTTLHIIQGQHCGHHFFVFHHTHSRESLHSILHSNQFKPYDLDQHFLGKQEDIVLALVVLVVKPPKLPLKPIYGAGSFFQQLLEIQQIPLERG